MINFCVAFFHFTVQCFSPSEEYPMTPTKFPYLASLIVNFAYICSGTLITVDHVLSAAQCIVKIIQDGGPNYNNASILVDLTLPMQFRVNYGIAGIHHYHYTPSTPHKVEEIYDAGLVLVGLSSSFKLNINCHLVLLKKI